MKFIHYIAKGIMIYNSVSWKVVRGVAVLAVFAMFLIMYTSSQGESAIMDELAHIPAGYSYVQYGDMRINPEHPPILKDIAAAPLLFLDLNFPLDSKAWTSDVNGQWDLGKHFLYEVGNDADRIVFWTRIGPMLLTALFGFLLFRLGSEFFGKRVALLATILFAFSPALLAHGKYVTTDVAAAFGFFIGIAYFLKYLREPSRRNLVIAGLAFGIAEGLKFSLILLIPFFIGIALIWVWTHERNFPWRHMFAEAGRMIGRVCMIFAIGYIGIIWPLYQIHVWNYPAAPADQAHRSEIIASQQSLCRDLDIEKIGVSQYRDSVCNLKTFRPRVVAETVIWMSDKPVLRPFAQYALGVLMVGQRTVGGNTTYFLGEVARDAWKSYFPVVYLLKEPLAMHFLTLIALVLALGGLRKGIRAEGFARIKERCAAFLRRYFVEVTMVLFIAFYWATSITANLNIGVRHIIPTFPFMFLVVSRVIIGHLRERPQVAFDLSPNTLKSLTRFYTKKAVKYTVLVALVGWYIVSVIMQYPHFITYFNELAGGPQNGYKYVADSNVDWGQDMKRLAQFVDDNNIDKIHLMYFGGGSPDYYLKDKYVPWWSSRGPEAGWFAISATFLDEAFGTPVGRYTRTPEDSYLWLVDKTPVTVIGHSIFIYKLD